ncbi:hypothetical protein FVE85_4276 [Porphyridium purpureum]|uniref:Uncharacterized protein n=1 Tax=Porphyridium purpureum TaxID=35688 RepID=A0A5J4YS16_PORPP|nr:hypothetical protein FVE85_4276 [Porphyridium purpureum]|eukprot:POR2647..scf229_5
MSAPGPGPGCDTVGARPESSTRTSPLVAAALLSAMICCVGAALLFTPEIGRTPDLAFEDVLDHTVELSDVVDTPEGDVAEAALNDSGASRTNDNLANRQNQRQRANQDVRKLSSLASRNVFVIQPPLYAFGLGNQLMVINNAFKLTELLRGRLVMPEIVETWHNREELARLNASEQRTAARSISLSALTEPTELSLSVFTFSRVRCTTEHSIILSSSTAWNLNTEAPQKLVGLFAKYLTDDSRLDFPRMRAVVFGELVRECSGQLDCIQTHLSPGQQIDKATQQAAGSSCVFVADFNVNTLKTTIPVPGLYHALQVNATFKAQLLGGPAGSPSDHVPLNRTAAVHIRWNERSCPDQADADKPMICVLGTHNTKENLIMLPGGFFLDFLERRVSALGNIDKVIFLMSPFVPKAVADYLRTSPLAARAPYATRGDAGLGGLERNLADFLLALDVGIFYGDFRSSWSGAVSDIRRAKQLRSDNYFVIRAYRTFLRHHAPADPAPAAPEPRTIN